MLRRSRRKLRTVFHSGPLKSASAAAISASARARSLSRPSASNRSRAARARRQADLLAFDVLQRPAALRQAAAAALATPRASRPCRFEAATRASVASALAHAASAPCQARWSTPRASRAVWNRSRPWASGVVSSAARLCRATPPAPRRSPWRRRRRRIPGRRRGPVARCQTRPLRSAELWQKTAVRLAGSIPTRVGRPQKNLVQGEVEDLLGAGVVERHQDLPGLLGLVRRPSDRSSSDRGRGRRGAGPRRRPRSDGG